MNRKTGSPTPGATTAGATASSTRSIPATCRSFAMQWAFQVADLGQFETTPLVVDGVFTAPGKMTAPSRSTPAPAAPSGAISAICPTNSSPAAAWSIVGSRSLVTSLSWPRSTVTSSPSTPRPGNLVWDVKAADSTAAYVFTVAPLVVKNEVIVGISGGEYGVTRIYRMPTMRTLAAVAGASIPFRVQASRATRLGPEIPGKPEARRRGSPAPTIPS